LQPAYLLIGRQLDFHYGAGIQLVQYPDVRIVEICIGQVLQFPLQAVEIAHFEQAESQYRSGSRADSGRPVALDSRKRGAGERRHRLQVLAHIVQQAARRSPGPALLAGGRRWLR